MCVKGEKRDFVWEDNETFDAFKLRWKYCIYEMNERRDRERES